MAQAARQAPRRQGGQGRACSGGREAATEAAARWASAQTADYDCWLRDGVELVAGYGNDGKLGHICFELGDRARRQ